MKLIPLDAQIRMAEHLKSVGWTVLPPLRYHTRLDQRGMPKPHVHPKPETFKKISKTKEREITRLVGTNKHRILKALYGTIMSTQELMQSGLKGGVSSRLTELRHDGYVITAPENDWVNSRVKRYMLTEEGVDLLRELERKKTNGR